MGEDNMMNEQEATPDVAPEAPKETPQATTETAPETETGDKPKRQRRRGGRRTKAKATDDAVESTDDAVESTDDAVESTDDAEATEAAEPTLKKKRTRRKTTAKNKEDAPDGDESTSEEAAESKAPAKKKAPTRKKSPSSSSRYRRPDRLAIEVTPIGPTGEPGARTMVVDNESPEECRIAFIENGVMEEFYLERRATATSVGNIYKARVVNVESAIQAAFVDYGSGINGFLHVSDLHPRYFPGGDKTENVGRKTPRHERPPIQEALKRGQEILVQVLKQGVGTKGPTLTSYLSMPGRLLVMMPEMDRVGVSRKVEDDELRKKARKILGELDLPEGFGFILRTAGFEHSKTDLKRDVAYLQRLWKQIEKRMNSVGAPAELYTEGNLLIRSIRDLVDGSIGKIITNSREAFETTTQFLSIVAPRSAPPVLFYDGDVPLFEEFGIERQVDRIHSREVQLRSGGGLVIDQAEALVAIDVNSGRSRSARDSETNAYQTNCEAVDEMTRQLRLRDLGGLVIADLIDMRMASHRKAIEDRLAEGLRRDRARTTFLPISEFGIVEMTRQRMRPSMRSLHFTSCKACKGIGELRSPDSIGADVIRRLAWLISFEKIARVEVVCSPRGASSLLSTYRRRLDDLERPSGKRIDVRISDAIALDEFNVYAYDESNADIDLAKLPRPKAGSTTDLLETLPELDESTSGDEPETGGRRRRRRRRPGPADVGTMALAGGFNIDEEDEDEEETKSEQSTSTEDSQTEKTDGEPRKKRRRRGGRRRGRGRNAEETPAAEPKIIEASEPIRVHVLAKELDVPSKELLDLCREKLELDLKTHMSSIPAESIARLRLLIAGTVEEPVEEAVLEPTNASAAESTDDDDQPRKKRRRRRGRGRGRRSQGDGEETASDAPPTTAEVQAETKPEPQSEPVSESKPEPAAKPKRRSLYRGQRRSVPAGTTERPNDR
jgi:ribonuclease E